MEMLIERLMDQVGLDRATAEKVADFIRNNSDDIMKWVGGSSASGMMDKAKGMFK